MPSVLFVCTANQFRSPLCAALFLKQLKENRTENAWKVESAGTWVPRKSGAHPEAINQANRLGVDLSRHETREVSRLLLEGVDLVVVMTQNQKEALQVEFEDLAQKIKDLPELTGKRHVNISDPAEEGFRNSAAIADELQMEITEAYPILVKTLRGN